MSDKPDQGKTTGGPRLIFQCFDDRCAGQECPLPGICEACNRCVRAELSAAGWFVSQGEETGDRPVGGRIPFSYAFACQNCGYGNSAAVDICVKCGAPRPAGTSWPEP